MFELTIALIIGLYVGYQIGVSLTAWRLRDIIYKEAKARGMVSKDEEKLFDEFAEEEEVKEPVKPNVFKLFVEKAQDTLYLYDHDANTFVCQAKTMEELASLALKYKNIKYAAVLDGDNTYMFVDGSVKKHL